MDRKTISVEMVEALKILDKDDLIRKDILESAQKLFVQYGIEKTTMEDIAKAAGKGKSTLYYYYKSKSEIFEAVVMQEIEEVFLTSEREVAKQKTAEQKIRVFIQSRFETMEKNRNLFKIMLGELNKSLTCFDELRKIHYKKDIDYLVTILSEGLNSGEFSGLKGKDLEIVSYVIISSIGAIKFDMMMDVYPYDFNTTKNAMLELLIHSFKTAPH